MNAAPSRVDLRPAEATDLDALVILARRTIDACYRPFLGDDAVDAFIDSGASDAHVAHHLADGVVFCAVSSPGQIRGFSILDGPGIELMMVDPSYHRQGLGRFLLAHAEQVLFAEHARIRLESFAENAAANAFYRACGWCSGAVLDADSIRKVEFTKDRPPGYLHH